MYGGPCRIDLHMHSSVSDGTDTPEQLLHNVTIAGIGVFSVTDHDAVKAASVIRGLLGKNSPVFIPGAEFSCRDGYGRYHILGYGFDPESGPILELVGFGHALRMRKVKARLDFVVREFGFEFSDDEIERLLSLDNPGKPHIGNLMVSHGYAESIKDAIDNYIDKLEISDDYLTPEDAISGIIGGGGAAVIAHPFYGSGDELILGDEMEKRIRRLKRAGLCGIEAYYSGFSPKLQKQAVALADKYDLYVTAGSDYHGKNKLVKLGDTGLPEGERPERLRRFIELFV